VSWRNRYYIGFEPLSSSEGSGFKLVISTMFLFLLIGCNCCTKQEKNLLPILLPDAVYKLAVKEPSDLCFGSSTDILFTVSDNTAQVYKITNTGKVLEALKYIGSDLEGVTYAKNQFLYVAEERLRSIEQVDLQGNLISHYDVPVENNDENSGLEGITYNAVNNCFYILNEINPGLLIITNEQLNILKEIKLKFADDYSGICIDEKSQELWIVSDLSATVSRCTLNGELIDQFRIPVNNPEGIAVDTRTRKMFIVSDREARLYQFTINQ